MGKVVKGVKQAMGAETVPPMCPYLESELQGAQDLCHRCLLELLTCVDHESLYSWHSQHTMLVLHI